MLDQFVLKLLLKIGPLAPRPWHAVNGVHHEVKAIQIVQYCHVEGRGDRAFFLVAPDMDIPVVRAAVGKPMKQPRVSMKGEDDRLVLCEEIVKIVVAQSRRMSSVAGPQRADHVERSGFELWRCLRRWKQRAGCPSVGTSPQQAIMTSGSPFWSLLAHCQRLRRPSAGLTASSIVNHCGAGYCPQSRHRKWRLRVE